MKFSENQLKFLSKTNPQELAKILSSPNSDINTLTFGAEILGSEVNDPSLVEPVLKQLMKHINAIVREGALIGIEAFFINSKPSDEILNKLKSMSDNDPSPIIRQYSKDLIIEFEERK